MIQLEITYKTKMPPITEAFLRQSAKNAAKVLRLSQNFSVSLVFIGPQVMKRLNFIYRKKNKVTDVLSFEGLNEIFICLIQAKKQSKEHRQTLKQEVALLLVHGILHLLGYDHQTDRQNRVMENLQEKILKVS